MTHDPIHDALAARADEHERAFFDATATAPPPGLIPLATDSRNRSPSRVGRRAVAAAAICAAAIAGGLALRDNTPGPPTLGDGTVDATGTADNSDEDLTEDAAREHLNLFVTALNGSDFATAAEALGGGHVNPDVAAALAPEPDEDLAGALERYCSQDLTFCRGLVVGERASTDEALRSFLVTTPIPPGSLGGGEPQDADVEHSTPFRVDSVNGTLRVLDLPPVFSAP